MCVPKLHTANHLAELGFMIRSDLVSFTTLDVCVLLGLRIGGCMVDLQRESQDSPIRRLFPSTHVYVKMIFDELQKRQNDVNVDASVNCTYC